MLSAEQIVELEDILFAEPWAEDAFDFFGLHGLVTASAVGPTPLPDEQLFALATGQDTDTPVTPPAGFVPLCRKLEAHIRSTLEQGESLELPEPEEGDAEEALENWCAGFVEAFLSNEEQWLAGDDENVAHLLVPVMTLSGLFEDEDFEKARGDDKVSQELTDQIPDSLTDLYLLFHTPG